MRKDITFTSKGARCRGWLYVPDDLAEGQKAPVIVMVNGFSGVKEMILPDFAERFVGAGFVTLAFDFRYFGDSEGEPRSQLFPLHQVEDVRNAITWVSGQPEVDPQRVGLWGTSYGGGIVVYVATFDKRVKAVVAQAPSTMSPEFRRAMDPDRWDHVGDFLLRDRIERYKTGAVNHMKVVAPEGEPCVLPGEKTYEAYMGSKESSPNWRNQVTIESLEKMREFDPVSRVHWVAPTALLLIPAEKDSLIPVDAVRETYERAREPKALSVLPIEHFEIYEEPWLSKAAGAAIDWFEKHLWETLGLASISLAVERRAWQVVDVPWTVWLNSHCRLLHDAHYIELNGEPIRRVCAYRKAAWAIEYAPQDLGLIYRQMGVKRLESIENVGPN